MEEALEIYDQFGDTMGQGWCSIPLALLLRDDKQFDAAEEIVSRTIGLILGEVNPFPVCQSHRILGEIYQFKGKIRKAIHHYEMTLEIASSFNWRDDLFGTHYSLAALSLLEFRHNIRESVAKCGLGRLRMDTYLLVAGFSLLVPLSSQLDTLSPDQLNSHTYVSFCFWFSHVVDTPPI